MIKIEQLSYQYPRGPLIQFPDFEVQASESLLVFGNSGCGKTTLLHLLAGLLRPTTGEIWINNTPLSQIPKGKIDQFRGQQIGLVYQKPYFVESLTVLDNLIISPYCNKKKRVERIAEQLGIYPLLRRYPHQLSMGQQQRATIARAVMNHPKLLLADEPTSALDYSNSLAVIDLLLDEGLANDAALVIVTHDDRLKNEVNNSIELAPIATKSYRQ